MGWVERVMAVVAGIATVAAVSAIVARSEVPVPQGRAVATVHNPTPVPPPPTAKPPTPAPTRRPTPPAQTAVGAITTTGLTALRSGPAMRTKSLGWLEAGVLAPVIAAKHDFYKVMTPFERIGWVHASKARTHAKAGARPRSLKGATIVIDPGHGGHLPGAKGPGGLTEKDANLGISRRLLERLTGARVFLTRGDGHAGLAYRSALANRLRAHAFISVHNNALPDRLSKQPGSEVYYQRKSKDGKRLAGLIYEELVKTFRRFDIVWGRDPFAGAKYRKSHQHGGEYYAVLRRTLVPAVISEGMFITNKPEENLLRRPEVRQLYAEALGRAVKRYFTTHDPGSGFRDPYAEPTPHCPIPGCFEHRK